MSQDIVLAEHGLTLAKGSKKDLRVRRSASSDSAPCQTNSEVSVHALPPQSTGHMPEPADQSVALPSAEVGVEAHSFMTAESVESSSFMTAESTGLGEIEVDIEAETST